MEIGVELPERKEDLHVEIGDVVRIRNRWKQSYYVLHYSMEHGFILICLDGFQHYGGYKPSLDEILDMLMDDLSSHEELEVEIFPQKDYKLVMKPKKECSF